MLIYMYPMMSSCYRNIFNVKYLENGVEFNSGKTGNHPWASHCTMIFDLGRPHRAVLDPAADPCNQLRKLFLRRSSVRCKVDVQSDDEALMEEQMTNDFVISWTPVSAAEPAAALMIDSAQRRLAF